MRLPLRTIFILLFAAGFAGAAPAQESAADASITGLSRAFNPAISVNGLFYALGSSSDEPLWEEMGLTPGLHLQEVSLEFTSNVDVYLKALVVLCVSEEGEAELEEAYVTTLQMPIPVTIRGGQMFNYFGQHNLLHAHHMAFAEPPMIQSALFGPQLGEMGVEASYLVPLPWYMDFTAGVLNGNNPYLFEGDEQDDLAYLAHLDNLFDLNDELALRLGGSFLAGEKGLHYPDANKTPVDPEIDEIISEVWGLDFHLKWKPLEYGRYRSLVVQGEYMEGRLRIDDDLSDPLQGFFVQAIGQFDLRWYLQARYDWVTRPQDLTLFFPEPAAFDMGHNEKMHGERWSFALAYVPTEFSAYRLQYNVVRRGDDFEYQLAAQVNVTVGSHPAHKY